MNNILWIVDKFLPNPSSNGACVSKLHDTASLDNNSYVLSVIDNKTNALKSEYFIYCEHQRRPSSYITRILGFAQDSKMVDAIFKSACHAIEEYKIDTVVCVYRPVECILAGIKLKKKYGEAVNIIGYFLDNIAEISSNSPVKARLLSYNQKRLLKRISKIFDKILALKYYKTMGEILHGHSKIDYVGIPNLVKPIQSHNDTCCKFGTDKKINLVYTGSFYEKIREPEPALLYIKNVMNIIPSLTLHLYSWGCENQISCIKEIMKDRLIIHGRVSQAEALNAILNSDILLNVGNDLPNQVPGKLIEYFSTGKPVICYTYRDDDPATEDYKKYKNTFLIKKGNEASAIDCADFIKNAFSQSWDDVSNNFQDCLPSYTIGVILSKRGKYYV